MRWNLDETPDLSPDLEWMLQSGQASRYLIAETLLEEFYPSVFNLALAYLGDEKASRAAALDVFRSALANSARYRPTFGVKAWLFKQAIKACTRTGLRNLQRFRNKANPHLYIEFQEELSPSGQLDISLWKWIQTLPGPLRMAVLLRYLSGFEEREIALVLGQTGEQVRAQLERAWQQLQANLGSLAETQPEMIERQLSETLSARFPERQLSESEIQGYVGKVFWQDNRLRRIAPLGELLWIGLAVLAVVGLSWMSRPAAPGPDSTLIPLDTSTPGPTQTPDYSVSYYAQPGETLLSISAKTGIPLEELTRLNPYTPNAVFNRARRVMLPAPPIPQEPTPVPPLGDVPGPLTALSQPASLQKRLSTSQPLWQTLWVDAQFVNYGPPGYVGPSQAYRTQVWISWPDQSIQLVGPVNGEPLYRFIIEGNYIYFFSRESNASWYSESPELLVSWSALSSLIFPNRAKWLHARGAFQVTGEEDSAGRPAIVADWKNPSGQRQYRLWIDAQTGIILHQQEFGGQDGQAVIADYSITAINYNASFPPELFDPSHNSLEYAQDYLGKPRTYVEPPQHPTAAAALQREPLQRQTAPPGFDPARSQLTFQYPEGQPSQGSAPLIDLFAGRFYLGSLPFADPWNTQCTRSPDGRQIAFSLKPGWQESGNRPNTGLHWFDLADLQIHSPPGRIEAYSFAFAPDSRRLAVFGYPVASNPGIDLVDTGTGEITRLMDLQQAESLVWSPDGKQLALVGERPGGYGQEVLVLDTGTGQVIYHTPIDPQIYQQVLDRPETFPRWPNNDWPGHDWGIHFPVKMGGLEACSTAPLAVTGNQ